MRVPRWIRVVMARPAGASRSATRRSRVAGLLLALLAVGVLGACADSSDAEKRPEVRDVAPGFSLPMLGSDAAVSLESLVGKTVIIDFWATWCTPCEFQVPELNAFHDAHRADSDVVLFGISIDTVGPEEVAEWTLEKGVRYPILLADDELAIQYGAQGFPTVVVIRGDGTIDSRHAGLIQQDELEEILSALREEG